MDPTILAWFLGPKAENERFLEDALLQVLRDYCHWRRNYFPDDPALLSRRTERELAERYDVTHQYLLELMARMRRNFPFYSPRYLAHQLSETHMASIVGYVAGLLYNPNNVTPEAAPVTVEMELEACNLILEVLGFKPPPDLPDDPSAHARASYRKQLEREFGWAHLTLGGTTANLEALWAARAATYAPLAVWDVAKREKLQVEIKFPDGRAADLATLPASDAGRLLNVKPNESIYLLAKYVSAWRLQTGDSLESASETAGAALRASDYSLAGGVGRLFHEFPPVMFVSGTAHYSIQKAADVLGIGRENVEFIATDEVYRLEVSQLRRSLLKALRDGRTPLAVIPILGTTEEGAVDPVHRVLDLRENLEKEKGVSFWVHVDAAWGGYLRTLFHTTPDDQAAWILTKIADQAGFSTTPPDGDLYRWHGAFFTHLESYVPAMAQQRAAAQREKVREIEAEGRGDVGSPSQGGDEGSAPERPPDVDGAHAEIESELREKIAHEKRTLARIRDGADLQRYLAAVQRVVNNYREFGLEGVEPRLTLEDQIKAVNQFVSDEVTLRYRDYSRTLTLQWGAEEVCSAFVALGAADSVTVDPHKMAYVNYPCGLVAFKNDRVRHLLLQETPYLTSVRQDVLVHTPPRHGEGEGRAAKTVVEAFAPFISEGSRPGAAATALWLTLKSVPPFRDGAGLIMRESLLAARELHAWLVHWEKAKEFNKEDLDYCFVPLSPLPPDTNIVVFAVKKRTSNKLQEMNRITTTVYDRFSIQSELGDREYSYSQPYFLSKTTFREPAYPYKGLKSLFKRCFERYYDKRVRAAYKEDGLVVLRATVMNPYHGIARALGDPSPLASFVRELGNASEDAVGDTIVRK